MVNLFAELRGIRGLEPARRLELLPYTLVRASRFESEDGNPFATGHRETAGHRPGSNLYLVWSQARSGFGDEGKFSFSDDFRQLFDIHPFNVLAIKLSHWLPL